MSDRVPSEYEVKCQSTYCIYIYNIIYIHTYIYIYIHVRIDVGDMSEYISEYISDKISDRMPKSYRTVRGSLEESDLVLEGHWPH